ncbi:hypothetical protein GCM10010282_54460 [Streptomyces roseolus]|nr:hypothetical protein GCM10010282_54460 [Streptomyces roseolus]
MVSAAAPPRTAEEAEAVTAEHFAFCPDTVAQGDHGTPRAYAHEALVGAPAWNFRWDRAAASGPRRRASARPRWPSR